MTTDFRALCAELADSVELLLEMRPLDAKPMAITEDRLIRARAALAAPEQGPMREELREMFDENDWNYISPETFEDIALTVLARWGRPVVKPVPVSEWHEDVGGVLWWRFPIEEPPYVGSPLDTDWPGHHTHFTLLPVPQEGTDG
jgi:hypothetical protein